MNHKLIKNILIAFFLGRFLNIEYLQNNKILAFLYPNISRLIFIMVFIDWLRKKKNKDDIQLFIMFIVYFAYILCITIINNGKISTVVAVAYPILGTFLFFSIESKSNLFLLIKSYAILIYTFVFINLVDMILYKDLSSQYSANVFFIGLKNQIGIVLAIGFCFIILYTSIQKNKVSMLLKISYIFIIFTTAILSKSGTTIVSIVMLLLFMIIDIDKFVLPIKLLISYFILLLGVIYYKVQEYFSFIIVDILHKDITFTSRTLIWDEAIKKVVESKFLGHGMHEDGNYFGILGNSGKYKFLSAHNQIIQMLYEGGFIWLILFIIIFLFCCYKGKKTKFFKPIYLTIIAIFISWFAEVPGIYSIFLMCILSYYIDRL